MWRSLRVKWTLGMLLVALVPMAFIGWRVLDLQRQGLARAESELQVAVVDEAAKDLHAKIEEATNVSVRAVAIVQDATLDLEVRTRMLKQLAAQSPHVAAILFFNPEREFVDAIVKEDSSSETREPPEKDLPEPGRLRLVGPHHVLHHEVQIPNGFLVVETQSLDASLRDLSRLRFGADDRVYLIRSTDLTVLAGARGKTKAPPLAIAQLLTTEIDDNVITVRTIPKMNWALVVERPMTEAYAALTDVRRLLIAALVLAIVASALAGVVIARIVTRPLTSLMSLVDRYARREFSARSIVKSGDELESLGGSLERMADDLSASEAEITKRARIEANLRRYMPTEAAEAATESGLGLELGGSRRRVTILFADVVAFTGFAERTPPEKSVAFLNELFTLLSEIVFRHHGMVDKFIGDCVMAVFRPNGDPRQEGDDDVTRALRTAEDMHSFVESNMPRWREAYAFHVELGIGVATGDVLIGNLGSESRMEYTVIGDAVNVAARLEALAAPKQTLTTADVVRRCREARCFEFASLGEHTLRGKAQPVEVFEVRS